MGMHEIFKGIRLFRASAPSRLLRAVLLACVALMAQAPLAHATFHEVLVSELYPGSVASPQSSFLELRMYNDEQNLVGGHTVTLYQADGSPIHTFTFPTDLPGKGVNQQTMLVGDSAVAEAFGVTPDLVDAGFNIPAAGGAACWDGLDCVSWGSFSGQTAPSSGIPVDQGGIPDGKAIERRITGGACSNWLEPADDTNDSDSDFFDATPSPVSYATVPVTPTCTPPLPTPTVTLDTKPPSSTKSTEAKFAFHASSEATGFECRLDLGSYKDCTAGAEVAYSGLAEGAHSFRVRASNANGVGTPSIYAWTVDLTPPTAKISSHPADPSPGNSASFRYGSSDGGTKFECRLSPLEVVFTPCTAQPKVYSSLVDGKYEFEVLAIDNAGNVQAAPTAFTWTVDNSLLDETPPETAILSKPADPSTSPVASFTYSSNEPGSSFQCKLDGGNFSGCPGAGITYSGLAEGPHTFQVRAIDASHNTDPTPAGYSFSVVLPGSGPAGPGTTAAPSGPKSRGGVPNTTIAKQATRTHDRTPTFRFGASKAGASFQCKLDGGPFRGCSSPLTTKKLGYGSHTLRVRAVVKGATDPTPAKLTFRIVKG